MAPAVSIGTMPTSSERVPVEQPGQHVAALLIGAEDVAGVPMAPARGLSASSGLRADQGREDDGQRHEAEKHRRDHRQRLRDLIRRSAPKRLAGQ